MYIYNLYINIKKCIDFNVYHNNHNLIPTVKYFMNVLLNKESIKTLLFVQNHINSLNHKS